VVTDKKMKAEKYIAEDLAAIKENIWKLLATVPDPEIPVLSVLDLGIIRSVDVYPAKDDNHVQVKIVVTPTYTGCPAMDMISMGIRLVLLEHGYHHLTIESSLSPAWTTEWMSEAGREKLKTYGIAPPQQTTAVKSEAGILFAEEKNIECPHCSSVNTRLISEFSSTACKALCQCNDCKEPFDYFKCH
jgi:ring-1,2-phenylacetyl-CoA epoxidase subunit PaaD